MKRKELESESFLEGLKELGIQTMAAFMLFKISAGAWWDDAVDNAYCLAQWSEFCF